ncbi:MAG: hypothetical protein K9H62_23035 [Bacteroidales bacterium]|nr:hypothetical protein [Bacteroidales bacterium]
MNTLWLARRMGNGAGADISFDANRQVTRSGLPNITPGGNDIVEALENWWYPPTDAPIIDAFTLAGNAGSTVTKLVPIELTTSGGAYSQYRIKEGTFGESSPDWDGIDWKTGTVPSTFTLSDTNGNKQVWLQIKNDYGESLEEYDDIALAIEIPDPLYMGYRLEGEGSTITEDIILGTTDPAQQLEMDVATNNPAFPSKLDLSWKDEQSFGLDEFTLYWMWVAIPESRADAYVYQQNMDFEADKGGISGILVGGSYQSVEVDGKGYRLYVRNLYAPQNLRFGYSTL